MSHEFPNYTQIPNVFFDHYMKIMTDDEIRHYLSLVKCNMKEEAASILSKYDVKEQNNG
jgi:hypothetical protein